MATSLQVALGTALRLHIRFSSVPDGDLNPRGSVPDEVLRARRDRLRPGPWTWLHQVHGAGVVVVTHPGEHAGAEADAAVTAVTGATLAVHTADCVPVVLASPAGVLGAVHVGWRGVVAGVLPEVVGAMRELGADVISGYVGPHICAEHYEFGAPDLAAVAAVAGDGVRATSASGTPALDMTAAATAVMVAQGVDVAHVSDGCTAETADLFSHRARGDTGRQATVAWLEAS